MPGPNQESNLTARSKESLKFRRQIKLFEKLPVENLHESKNLGAQPLLQDGDEKPTFLFGEAARAQYV